MATLRGNWRWALVVLLAYAFFPVAWGLIAVKGTTPPLSGGGAGMAELASYTHLDLRNRLEPALGAFWGSLLLSFPLAFVGSLLGLGLETRRRREQEFEERLREARAEIEARKPERHARAIMRGRVDALQEIAHEIRSDWPGADRARWRRPCGRCAAAPSSGAKRPS